MAKKNIPDFYTWAKQQGIDPEEYENEPDVEDYWRQQYDVTFNRNLKGKNYHVSVKYTDGTTKDVDMGYFYEDAEDYVDELSKDPNVESIRFVLNKTGKLQNVYNKETGWKRPLHSFILYDDDIEESLNETLSGLKSKKKLDILKELKKNPNYKEDPRWKEFEDELINFYRVDPSEADIDTAIYYTETDWIDSLHQMESLEEDIVKQNGKWVNKGKEGTHGSFRLKGDARKQQQAMFRNGYKGESLDEANGRKFRVTGTLRNIWHDDDGNEVDREEWEETHTYTINSDDLPPEDLAKVKFEDGVTRYWNKRVRHDDGSEFEVEVTSVEPLDESLDEAIKPLSNYSSYKLAKLLTDKYYDLTMGHEDKTPFLNWFDRNFGANNRSDAANIISNFDISNEKRINRDDLFYVMKYVDRVANLLLNTNEALTEAEEPKDIYTVFVSQKSRFSSRPTERKFKMYATSTKDAWHAMKDGSSHGLPWVIQYGDKITYVKKGEEPDAEWFIEEGRCPEEDLQSYLDSRFKPRGNREEKLPPMPDKSNELELLDWINKKRGTLGPEDKEEIKYLNQLEDNAKQMLRLRTQARLNGRRNESLDEAKNDTLNPAIWENDELKPEVKEKLQFIADKFIEKLTEDDIPLDVDDIVIVGSNRNYNYGPQSDIDLHIIRDLSEFKGREKELAEKIYQRKKSIFNDKYDPTINGFEVEIYVEPAEDKNDNDIPDEVEEPLEEQFKKPSKDVIEQMYDMITSFEGEISGVELGEFARKFNLENVEAAEKVIDCIKGGSDTLDNGDPWWSLIKEEIMEDKDLEEGLVQLSEEDIKHFESQLDELGFDIEGKGRTTFGNLHYQVILRGDHLTEQDLRRAAKRLNMLSDKMDDLGIPMTYNVGLTYDDEITAGLDLHKKYVKEEESLEEDVPDYAYGYNDAFDKAHEMDYYGYEDEHFEEIPCPCHEDEFLVWTGTQGKSDEFKCPVCGKYYYRKEGSDEFTTDYEESLTESAHDEIDQIYDYLQDEGLSWFDVSDGGNGFVVVSIEWGDWKHEHRRCDRLMMQIGYGLEDEEVTDEDGSDTYSSNHIYKCYVPGLLKHYVGESLTEEKAKKASENTKRKWTSIAARRKGLPSFSKWVEEQGYDIDEVDDDKELSDELQSKYREFVRSNKSLKEGANGSVEDYLKQMKKTGNPEKVMKNAKGNPNAEKAYKQFKETKKEQLKEGFKFGKQVKLNASVAEDIIENIFDEDEEFRDEKIRDLLYATWTVYDSTGSGYRLVCEDDDMPEELIGFEIEVPTKAILDESLKEDFEESDFESYKEYILDEFDDNGDVDPDRWYEIVMEDFEDSELAEAVYQFCVQLNNGEYYDADHAAEWMERNPHGYYNNESDYGTGEQDESLTEAEGSADELSYDQKQAIKRRLYEIIYKNWLTIFSDEWLRESSIDVMFSNPGTPKKVLQIAFDIRKNPYYPVAGYGWDKLDKLKKDLAAFGLKNIKVKTKKVKPRWEDNVYLEVLSISANYDGISIANESLNESEDIEDEKPYVVYDDDLENDYSFETEQEAVECAKKLLADGKTEHASVYYKWSNPSDPYSDSFSQLMWSEEELNEPTYDELMDYAHSDDQD